MKCFICGRKSDRKICIICNPDLDIPEDEDYVGKKKRKTRDIRRKRARQRKKEEWS